MTATTPNRRSNRATWLIGLVDGLLLGYISVVFGTTGMGILVVIFAASFAIFRNLSLVSGLMIGAGGIWTFLMVRQTILICNEPGRDPGICPPSGLLIFAAVGAVTLAFGIVLGVVARRRRPA